MYKPTGRIGEDQMLERWKLRQARKESIEQWRIIHLNLDRWNILNNRRWPAQRKENADSPPA